jgi:hypothetical protein
MSIYSVDGKRPSADVRAERIAAGTVGGEHAVPRSFVGQNVASIIDDADPAIIYGTVGSASASFTGFAAEGYTYKGTQTIIGGYDASLVDKGVADSAAQLTFNGTSIGVLGGTNPFSGTMKVYIDGVLTAGRLPTSVALNVSLATGPNAPIVTPTDMSITTLAIPSNFASAGTILIGKELITYSSKTGTVFTVSQRGAFGTTATNHYANETVYMWGSSTDLSSSTDYANKRLLYYNPFLSPGEHTITIVVAAGATGYTHIYFDGFVTGSLVGASNLFTQTGSITATLALDANGHCDIGGVVSNNSDVSIVGVLGYTQTDCEASTTNAMVRIGTRYLTDGSPYLYAHNGTAGANVTVVITFMFIGESL